MHWAVTIVAGAVIITGVLLFLQIDSPFLGSYQQHGGEHPGLGVPASRISQLWR